MVQTRIRGLNGSFYFIAQKQIPKGRAPKPQLKEGEKLIKETRSVCPYDYRLLPAIIFERDGKVWIRRVCPEHGETEELYWGDAEMYKRALQYEATPVNLQNTNVPLELPCPFNCGLCPLHKNYTALANIVLTNRCDLSCWYCFFFAEKSGYVYEPDIEEIRAMIRDMRKQGPWHPNAIQLTGGEPTLRDDLVDIIKMAKEEGITHIQLNTHGVTFARKWLEEGFESAVKFAKELREAGVNTIYMSFDGVRPQSNGKNHWEVPYTFEVFRAAGVTSVVLVPVVIRGVNDGEVGDIIRFGAMNMDIVRGVNFQPISITGSVPKEVRKKVRITIPDVIKYIEDQTEGDIPREAWYTIPWTTTFSDFIEALTHKPTLRMANNPACGMATYVFPEFEKKNGKRIPKRFVPITEFVDVDAFTDYLREKTEELKKGKSRTRVLMSILWNLRKFVDQSKAPEGVSIRKLLANIILKRNYEALGEFHYKALFLGMMHFMDLYNYDVARVERCNIHYLTPDPNRRIVPFCAFNVLEDIYRDDIQKKYGMPIEEWIKVKKSKPIGIDLKYRRNVKKLTEGEPYRKTYEFFGKKYGYLK
ncbi:MAG: tetraether lipid synthase Tes [Candidatus Njordarchaeia archaeon]